MPCFPKIQNPCPKQWDELQGDAKTRYCNQCDYQVHNLSESTPAEMKRILSQPGRKCIAYRAPVRPSFSLSSLLSRLGFLRPITALAALAITLFIGGCATTTREEASSCPPTIHDKAAAPKPSGDGKTFKETVYVGGVEERPLWHRILFFWE